MSVERELDEVLQGLRAVETPDGLEARVLGCLYEAEGSAPAERRRGGMIAIAGGCLVTLLAVGTVVRFGLQAPSQRARSAAKTTGSSPGYAPHHPAFPQTSPIDRQTADRVAKAHSGMGAVPLKDIPVAVEPVRTARQDSEEARAWAEMQAPSMPERPQPPTREEELLLEVAKSKAGPALAAHSLDTEAKMREQLSELGQRVLAGLDTSEHAGETHEETE